MSRSSSLIILGILIALTPFSGLPIALRSLLEVVFGACIFGVGFALRHERVFAAQKQHEPEKPIAPAEPVAPQISAI